MDKRYKEKRRSIEHLFKWYKRNKELRTIEVSPSKNYKLIIDIYKTGKNTWDYSRGRVYKISNNKKIADIKRNYGHFWHAWINHPNGYEYLLCGEDYQGYTIINLDTNNIINYFPESGYNGNGFCWICVYPSPDNLILAVDGCIWAGPYDIIFYDFTNPEIVPLRQIYKFEKIHEVNGWSDNEHFTLYKEIEIRKSDGIPYDNLDDEEQNILDKDASLLDYRIETKIIERKKFEL